MGPRIPLLAALASGPSACAPAGPTPADLVAETGTDDAESTGADDDAEPAPPVSACPPDTEATAAPTTIGEVVTFINALPHPVTLDCFLERLARPMPLTSTFSTVSLQPAEGVRSPRLFLFYGDLVMSVAIDGDPGRTLLEFGELVSPTQSIKGELQFPIEDPLPVHAPMQRVFDGEGAECRLCHGFESARDEYEYAFASDALQFRPDELVELEALLAEDDACDPDAEPERCARLHAIFGHGEVVQSPFPYDLPTIYDYD